MLHKLHTLSHKILRTEQNAWHPYTDMIDEYATWGLQNLIFWVKSTKNYPNSNYVRE